MLILEHISKGFNNGIKISKKIVIFTFPFYIAVDLLKQLEILDKIGSFFSPVMKLIGLPGEASIAIISGMTLNLYAAIAAISPLDLNAKQITIMGLFLGIAHNLIIETVILTRTGIKALPVLSVRFLMAFFAAFIVNVLWI
ncbi:MAG: hypothetical protein PWQ25_1483 [Deferribacteres bacterium]|jgi:hypothetical protein|nr:hypothetical protein [Deferribacteres bacterium]